MLGFQLIYVEGGQGEPVGAHRHLNTTYQPKDKTWPDDETSDWIHWLHALSKTIVAAYLGEPLKSFQYVTQTVLEATYGDITITANLSAQPYALSQDIVISPHGFFATSDQFKAGLLNQYGVKNGEKMRMIEQ